MSLKHTQRPAGNAWDNALTSVVLDIVDSTDTKIAPLEATVALLRQLGWINVTRVALEELGFTVDDVTQTVTA